MIKTLTFFSNYFNHHQKALCDEFYSALGEGFHFIETEPIEEFRSKMGWGSGEIPPYVLKSYGSEEDLRKARELALSSEAVIMGTAPEEFIKPRMEAEKLTFRYSERPLKEGRWKILVPYLAKKFYVNHISNRKKPFYCLCAGAFVSSDYKFLMGSYSNKCYKFGYFPFPEKKSFKELSALKDANEQVRILWCGRFITLKRADLLLKACGMLKEKGYDFTLEMVGNGEEEESLKKLSYSLGLEVEFKGYMSPEGIREEMDRADIYVCTSNKLEGWGSVIYEGLSAGCATIATSKAGATPFLIKEGETGFVFASGEAGSLARKIELCLKDKVRMRRIGERAYEQMATQWNPRVAAERLLEAADKLNNGKPFYFEEGPMSKAEIMYEDWYRE